MKKIISILLLFPLLAWILPADAAEEEPIGVLKGSVEASLVTATGNAQTQTGSARIVASQRSERDRWIGRAGVLYGKSEGQSVASSYYANGEYNYFHSPKTYSIYFLGWEKDRLAGLTNRLTARIGLGHECIKTDKDFLISEAGVGYVYEHRTDGSEGYPEGRLHELYEHQFQPNVKFFENFEFLSDLTLMTNYRINSVTGIKVDINNQWSVRTSLAIHYDNQPVPGFRKTDTITETSLVYNF